jgi:hypothetical protein
MQYRSTAKCAYSWRLAIACQLAAGQKRPNLCIAINKKQVAVKAPPPGGTRYSCVQTIGKYRSKDQ